MKIDLSECPPELRERIQADTMKFLIWASECRLISVVGFDSTPYKDESRIVRCYEAIIMVGNTYFVYSQRHDGGSYDNEVSTASLTIGTVQNILENSPTWAGLPKLAKLDSAV